MAYYLNLLINGVVHEYEYLKVKEGKTVRCPYFRNPRSGKDRWGLNAFSGKGSPEEIEYEMPMIEKLERKDFLKMREVSIFWLHQNHGTNFL